MSQWSSNNGQGYNHDGYLVNGDSSTKTLVNGDSSPKTLVNGDSNPKTLVDTDSSTKTLVKAVVREARADWDPGRTGHLDLRPLPPRSLHREEEEKMGEEELCSVATHVLETKTDSFPPAFPECPQSPAEIKRKEVEMDSQESPGEI